MYIQIYIYMLIYYQLSKLFKLCITTQNKTNSSCFFGDSVTDPYVVGTYSTRMRARNKADKLDNEYGAYRYSVKAVEVAVQKFIGS